MATFTSRTRTTVTREFVVPLPTNPAEYAKAFSAATHAAESADVSTHYDDWLSITTDDENLILSFQVSQTRL